jgi:hypothetical protein
MVKLVVVELLPMVRSPVRAARICSAWMFTLPAEPMAVVALPVAPNCATSPLPGKAAGDQFAAVCHDVLLAWFQSIFAARACCGHAASSGATRIANLVGSQE